MEYFSYDYVYYSEGSVEEDDEKEDKEVKKAADGKKAVEAARQLADELEAARQRVHDVEAMLRAQETVQMCRLFVELAGGTRGLSQKRAWCAGRIKALQF